MAVKLTDIFVKKLKTPEKKKRYSDGNGLNLLHLPTGGKSWLFRYYFNGKDAMISVGQYPFVSLADARAKAVEYQSLLKQRPPVDPRTVIEANKGVALKQAANPFDLWANRWFDHWAPSVSDRHANYTRRRLDVDINPFIGELPVANVAINDLKIVMQKCVDRGAIDMASRVYQVAKAVLQYASEHQDQSHCAHNVANDIKLNSFLPHKKRKNYARIPINELPDLMQQIKIYQGDIKTRLALQLMPLVFVRTSELIEAKWSEIEFENCLWRIPKERMKKDTQHLVPLANQSMAILKSLHLVTGHGEYLFPNRLRNKPTMSNNTILKAIKQMGYQYVMTGHGFRGLARTQLAEHGYPREWMEIQLAHLTGSETERAYNSALFLKERRGMMQDWADYVDGLS